MDIFYVLLFIFAPGYGKLNANPLIMTKCHLAALLALLIIAGCKPDKGPSLSEMGSRSDASRQSQFEQYIVNLHFVPLEEALARQDSLLNASKTDSLEWATVTALEEKYLLDPNSPYRNEELYLPVASQMASCPLTSESQRERAIWLLPFLSLNRIGTPASDFSYITPTGRSRTLYQTIDARNPTPRRTLLFFSNPGCPNCKEITESLSGDPAIAERIKSGELLVVNIYPDEDVQAWLDYLPNYPSEWVCGYDPDQVLKSDTIYWLRAIPSLYLLDGDKNVILKDATLQVLMATLRTSF